MRTTTLLALLLAACAPSAADPPAGPSAPPRDPAGTFGTPACTLIGCDSGATVSLAVPASLAASKSAVIKACWRDRCSSARLPAAGEACQFAGPPAVSACSVQAGTLKLMINAPGSDVKDGDSYAVEISDPAGLAAEKAAIERAVKYTKIEPNGPGCAPACYQATIQ